MTVTTAVCCVIALIVFPVLLIWNLTESRHTKIQRARRNNRTWKEIANRYGVSPSTVRRWSIA